MSNATMNAETPENPDAVNAAETLLAPLRPERPLGLTTGDVVPPDTLHVGLDLETLGLRDGAIIGSVGAVLFSLEVGVIDTFYRRCDVFDAIDHTPLHMEGDTLKWWMKQSCSARDELFDPLLTREPVDVVLKALCQFVWNARSRMSNGRHGADGWIDVMAWSRNVFDQRIVEHACYVLRMEKPPFRYNRFRNIGDWLNVLDPARQWQPESADPGHHALADALHDVQWLLNVLRHRGLT